MVGSNIRNSQNVSKGYKYRSFLLHTEKSFLTLNQSEKCEYNLNFSRYVHVNLSRWTYGFFYRTVSMFYEQIINKFYFAAYKIPMLFRGRLVLTESTHRDTSGLMISLGL